MTPERPRFQAANPGILDMKETMETHKKGRKLWSQAKTVHMC